MSKIAIWTEAGKKKREELIDSLYKHCQARTSTSRQVFDGMVADLGLIGTAHVVDRALEIIRPYKNSGVNLESTADSLYALFYPEKDDSYSGTNWNPHEP